MNRNTPLRAKTGLKSTATLQPGNGLQRRTPLQPSGPVTASAEPKARVPAPRAPRGHMRAAVAMVLAGERTVTDAAREFSCDPERVTRQAGIEFRRIVRERDSFACLGCGAQASDVQHRVARGMGGTSDSSVAFSPANGASLCRDCHRTCEARDEGMHARGLWLWQSQDPAVVPVFGFSESGFVPVWLTTGGGYSFDPREGTAA